MARGGCLTCMHGGSSSVNTLLKLITTIGVFLILIGIIIYNKDILDIRIEAISKDTMNTYIGHFSLFLGILLLLISAMTWSRTQ
jgi:hypothetical protein